jgi:hypothetical protein
MVPLLPWAAFNPSSCSPMRRPERRRLALGTGTFLAAIIILFHHLSE